ncbi:glycosyl transferase [Desulfolithobacter dissulfuricans]|uniref:Glycosyl transferase n=1 Tax=Desulfolithobacter dissulfuricans TaxID=2795293 RepID=A0A915U368_9BACT|nr:glycosyltransferase family 4 protein [Desulfolithobacter dissulfuricans]BCO09767.1 glycosyl transferase [Desulfolithobacter dissulfuricans]
MHVLIFIHSLSAGGAERVTANLANHWAAKNCKITIVTMTGRERDFFELHPDVRRIALRADAVSAGALSAIRHNLHRVRVLRQVLKQEKPDVALGMMNGASSLLAIAAAGTGIPAIGSERTYPPEFPVGRVWAWLRRRTYPHLAAVVAQTEKSAQWLQARAGVRKVAVIPNPVFYPLPLQEPRVQPVQATASTPGCNILLAAGRLGPEKGFDRLLAAFAELAPRFPDWCLAIVGEGNCRSKLEKQVSGFALEDRVFLPGTVGNIGEWYEAADLYVMTSRFEGFPNTLVEALAHGLPAVSVDCDTGPRDILRHEIDGLLVPQDDHAALVEALAKVMGDEHLRHRYAASAIEARERFAMERIGKMWVELFSLYLEKNS